ncbi:MAG: hypothetical protein EHM88_18815, partial [Candidatus Rokuibacteriota bacterium]
MPRSAPCSSAPVCSGSGAQRPDRRRSEPCGVPASGGTLRAPEARHSFEPDRARVSDIDRLAALFAGARRPVVFTGAGVSTESGIPDFRSPGGVWARFDPRAFTYQSFVGSLEGRRRYWDLGRVTYPIIRAAVPNAAHLALAELHRLGRLSCC